MNRILVAQIRSSLQKRENLRTALDLIAQAKSRQAGVVVFPEFLMAYSPSPKPPRNWRTSLNRSMALSKRIAASR